MDDFPEPGEVSGPDNTCSPKWGILNTGDIPNGMRLTPHCISYCSLARVPTPTREDKSFLKPRIPRAVARSKVAFAWKQRPQGNRGVEDGVKDGEGEPSYRYATTR